MNRCAKAKDEFKYPEYLERSANHLRVFALDEFGRPKNARCISLAKINAPLLNPSPIVAIGEAPGRPVERDRIYEFGRHSGVTLRTHYVDPPPSAQSIFEALRKERDLPGEWKRANAEPALKEGFEMYFGWRLRRNGFARQVFRMIDDEELARDFPRLRVPREAYLVTIPPEDVRPDRYPHDLARIAVNTLMRLEADFTIETLDALAKTQGVDASEHLPVDFVDEARDCYVITPSETDKWDARYFYTRNLTQKARLIVPAKLAKAYASIKVVALQRMCLEGSDAVTGLTVEWGFALPKSTDVKIYVHPIGDEHRAARMKYGSALGAAQLETTKLLKKPREVEVGLDSDEDGLFDI